MLVYIKSNLKLKKKKYEIILAYKNFLRYMYSLSFMHILSNFMLKNSINKLKYKFNKYIFQLTHKINYTIRKIKASKKKIDISIESYAVANFLKVNKIIIKEDL